MPAQRIAVTAAAVNALERFSQFICEADQALLFHLHPIDKKDASLQLGSIVGVRHLLVKAGGFYQNLSIYLWLRLPASLSESCIPYSRLTGTPV
jgi:hypothetical protein